MTAIKKQIQVIPIVLFLVALFTGAKTLAAPEPTPAWFCAGLSATIDPEDSERYLSLRLGMMKDLRSQMTGGGTLNHYVYSNFGQEGINTFDELFGFIKSQALEYGMSAEQIGNACNSFMLSDEDKATVYEDLERDYLQVYTSYQSVKTCYVGREGKTEKLITENQWRTVERNFKQMRIDSNLDEVRIASVENKYRKSLPGQVSSNFQNQTMPVDADTKKQCSFALLAMTFGYGD